MLRRILIWGLPALLYGAFFGWYTNLSGPLTPDEINRYMTVIEARVEDPVRLAQLRSFMEADTGDDFLMINLLHFKEEPDATDGMDPASTSQEVMAAYMRFMWPELLSRASHPVMFGPAVSQALDLQNLDGATVWSQGAAMRYRSRRDMFEISTNPAFSGAHVYKSAALEKTVAVPVEDGFLLTDPRLLLFFVLLALAGVVNAVLRR